MQKPVILTVDDDLDVLHAIERDLKRHYEERYRVLRAESGKGALDLLHRLQQRNDAVALMVVDHRMPQMNGVEMLQEAIKLYPGAKRTLLTAYADAMGGKGELLIRTSEELDYVLIEIIDNGPGIPDAVKPHIFEPFYTTKGVGDGTGMGLDTVYRIVRAHHGDISVDSIPGHTNFQVRLPLA